MNDSNAALDKFGIARSLGEHAVGIARRGGLRRREVLNARTAGAFARAGWVI